MRTTIFVVLLALSAGTPTLRAQSTDSLQVTTTLGLLSVQSVEAGSEPAPVADSASRYSLTNTVSGQKIVAQLSSSLPSGVTLAVQLEAPAGAISLGMVTLSTDARSVVTNIPAGSYSGLRITYRLTATLAGGVVPTASRTVTYTLTPGP